MTRFLKYLENDLGAKFNHVIQISSFSNGVKSFIFTFVAWENMKVGEILGKHNLGSTVCAVLILACFNILKWLIHMYSVFTFSLLTDISFCIFHLFANRKLILLFVKQVFIQIYEKPFAIFPVHDFQMPEKIKGNLLMSFWQYLHWLRKLEKQTFMKNENLNEHILYG